MVVCIGKFIAILLEVVEIAIQRLQLHLVEFGQLAVVVGAFIGTVGEVDEPHKRNQQKDGDQKKWHR